MQGGQAAEEEKDPFTYSGAIRNNPLETLHEVEQPELEHSDLTSKSSLNATVNTLSYRQMDHVEDIEEYTIPKSILNKSSKTNNLSQN